MPRPRAITSATASTRLDASRHVHALLINGSRKILLGGGSPGGAAPAGHRGGPRKGNVQYIVGLVADGAVDGAAKGELAGGQGGLAHV